MPDYGYLNQDFLNQVLPAIGQSNPNLVQGLVPGVVNTGLVNQGAPPPPVDPAIAYGPPPPPEAAPAPAPAAATPAAPVPPPPTPIAAADVGSVRLIPGTKGTPEREKYAIGPQALEVGERATAEKIKGAEDVMAIQQRAAVAHAEAAAIAGQQARVRLEAAHAAQIAEDRKMDDARMQANQAAKDTSSIAPITDYWADRSTGQRIMSGISIALAGMGQAISGQGGPNPAAAMLEADMQRDLQTKQLRYQQQKENTGKKADAAQQNYNNLVKQVGLAPANDIVAAAQRDMVAAETEKRAALSKLPDIQANGVKMAADLRAERDDYLSKAAFKIAPAKGGSGATVWDPKIGINVPVKEYEKYAIDRAKERSQQEGRVELQGLKVGQEKEEKGAAFISEHLQTAKIPETLEAAKTSLKSMKEVGNKAFGTYADKLYRSGDVGRAAYKHLYGDKAVQAQEDWGLAESNLVNTLSGAGVPTEEMATRWAPAFRGANDVKSREHVLVQAQKRIDQQIANIKAGAGQAGAAAYDANLAAQKSATETNPDTGVTERPTQ